LAEALPRSELGGAPAALDAGLRTAILVEQLSQSFEHHAAQLLGVDDRDGAQW
jgi:hypothetical protein